MKICLLPGDGIGPEIMAEAVRVLRALDLDCTMEEALLGGGAVDATGDPYPEATQRLAQAADAVLLGAVGGPQWDALPREQRPGARSARHPQATRPVRQPAPGDPLSGTGQRLDAEKPKSLPVSTS
jgi:isocitrate/isopropylmalate dehydrogenase